jgi:hypothetical protein
MDKFSDAELLTAYREMGGEPDWFDHGGEIQAAWEEAVLVELEKRGYKLH